MSIVHPLEGVGRGSETQLQSGKKLNYLIEHLALCLRGFVKLKKSKNPRKTRKWVGGSSPNSDLSFFGNFVFFCVAFFGVPQTYGFRTQ